LQLETMKLGLRMAEPQLFEGSRVDVMGAGTQRHWLVVYTRARHENTVARQLESKAVDFLLPTYALSARWSDRVKRVKSPLFPCYVFVHVNDDERVCVLQTAGVVNIVSVAGKPAALRDEEIAVLRECVVRPDDVEPHPFLQVGQRVRVKHGPFEGWEGILAYKKNSARLVVNVRQIMQSVSVNLDGADVEEIACPPTPETRQIFRCHARPNQL
jgi:transcription antitermination factor NusG